MLEDTEPEIRYCGENVVEDVRLNRFVIGPDLITAEYVDLDRYAVFGRLQLPNKKCHIPVDLGVIFQIRNHIRPKGGADNVIGSS